MEDRVAVVTGGASGIGAATVRRLSELGAHVVVVDVDERAGTAIAADVGGSYRNIDVSDAGAWSRLVADLERELGGIDVAHLNAGVLTAPDEIPFVDTPPERYRRVMGVNLDGVAFGIHALAPAMMRRGGGAIVATASLAGLIPYGPDPTYAATKHAIVGLIRSVAPQLRRAGVRVHAICPGGVATPLVGAMSSDRTAGATRPMLDPSEVADAVIALLESDESGLVQSIVHGFGVRTHEYERLP